MKIAVALLPVGALAVLFVGQGAPPTPPPTTPPAVPTEPEKPDEALRPISYFAAHCAKCHGPSGSRYNDLSAKSDEQLLAAMLDPKIHPEAATISEAGLRLQICLHRAIRAKEPFVAILAVKDGKAEGEATPEATVTLVTKKKSVRLDSKDGAFSLETKDPKATVGARVGNKVAAIPALRIGTSHGR